MLEGSWWKKAVWKKKESVIKKRRQLRDRLLQAGVLWRHSQKLKGDRGTLKKAPSGIHAIHQSTARVTIWFCVCVCVCLYQVPSPWRFTLRLHHFYDAPSPSWDTAGALCIVGNPWQGQWAIGGTDPGQWVEIIYSFSSGAFLCLTLSQHIAVWQTATAATATQCDFKWDGGEITSEVWVKLSF